MTYLEKVGANIRYYRKVSRMSQEELAQRVGYSSKGVVAKIEAGGNDLPASKLKAIASALNVTVGQLQDEDATDRAVNLPNGDQMFLNMIHSVSDNERAEILNRLFEMLNRQ